MPSDAPFRVLVCGSREWKDYHKIAVRLALLPTSTIIMHGAARGADSLADAAARSLRADRDFIVEAFPADWTRNGRRAGFIRNSEMLALKPDLVIAFATKMSGGTWDTVTKARALGILTEVIFNE